MSRFERLVLVGLWLLLKHTLASRSVMSGSDEIGWAKDMAEAMGDDRYRQI